MIKEKWWCDNCMSKFYRDRLTVIYFPLGKGYCSESYFDQYWCAKCARKELKNLDKSIEETQKELEQSIEFRDELRAEFAKKSN